MKVLHLLDSLNRGGAETQVLDVCRNGREFGLEIVFVATGEGTLEKEFENSGVAFYRLQRTKAIDLKLAFEIRKIIKIEGVKIVHGYQAVEGIHLYLATLGTKKVKRVLSFQGGLVPDKKNLQALKFLIPRMNANVVVSEGLRQWHQEIDGLNTTQNFQVVFNGADGKRLISHKKTLRQELKLSESDLVFGMIANFYREKRKDQLTICKALPEVFAKIPQGKCIFVGKVEAGAEEKFAECVDFCQKEGISEKVFFLGGRNDIPDVLASLDLFVFSSFNEGLPVAVTEAMLSGLPLILSDIKPLLEVSDNGRVAEIFPVGNSEMLAEKIIKLLQNKQLRQTMAEKSKAFAKENFSIEAHLQSLRKLYKKILAE